MPIANERTHRISARQTAQEWWSNAPVIFDTETTGFHNADEIVSIAIIDRDGDVLLNSLVRPSSLELLPDEVVAIHGITREMLQDAPAWGEVQRQVYEVFGERLVLAYNAEYDTRMIAQSNKGAALSIVETVRVGCIMKLWAQYVGIRNKYYGGYKWLKLADACKDIGYERGQAHNAVDDCRAALAVLKAML